MQVRHILIFGFIAALSAPMAPAASPPLDRVDVYALLAAKALDVSVCNIVRHEGISFAPTAEDLARLREAGAGDALVKALQDPASIHKTDRQQISTREAAAVITHLENIAQLARKGSKKALDEAERDCRTALQMGPHNATLHFLLGYLLERRDRWQEAADEYRAALRLDPQNAAALVGLGAVLEQTGKPAEAIPQYQKALRLEPEFVEAHLGLGSAAYRLGYTHLSVTQAEYGEALRLAPQAATVHAHLCILIQGMNDLKDAEVECRKAIELDPSSAEAHVVLGWVLWRQNKSIAALEQFRAAVYDDSLSAQAHFGLGGALASRGCMAEAANEYRIAYGLNPFEPAIREKVKERAIRTAPLDTGPCGAPAVPSE
jgi:tetratricopeptide (TPR) repeat protein